MNYINFINLGEDTLNSPIYDTFYGSVFKSVFTKHHKSLHFEDMLKLVQRDLKGGKFRNNSEVKQSTCWEAKGVSKILYF